MSENFKPTEADLAPANITEKKSIDKESLLAELNSKKTRDYITHVTYQINPKLSAHDIDEITQEVMINANRAINNNQFRGDSTLKTWLTRIARNAMLVLLRKNSRPQKKGITTGIPEGYQAPSNSPNPEEKLAQTQQEILQINQRQALTEDMNSLPPRSKMIIERILRGKKPKEIMAELQIPGGTYRVAVFRAKKRLKELQEKRQKNKNPLI